jgi:hypothetical protein
MSKFNNTFSFSLFQGDARYLLSNSKDQTMKLWDIRMFSTEAAIMVKTITICLFLNGVKRHNPNP